MDVIAGAAFGLEVDSLQNPDDSFHRHGQGLIDAVNNRFFFFSACWQPCVSLLKIILCRFVSVLLGITFALSVTMHITICLQVINKE